MQKKLHTGVGGIPVSELLFMLAWGIYISFYFLWTTYFTLQLDWYGTVIKLVKAGVCVVLLLKLYYDLFVTKAVYRPHNVFAIIAYCLLAAAVLLFGYLKSVFVVFLFIFSAANVSLRRLVRFTMILESALLAVTVSAALIGLITNQVERGDRVRYFLGFDWMTTPVNYFYHIVLMWLALKRGKVRAYEIVIIMVLNVFFFKMTDTRAGFLLITMLLAASVFMNLWKKPLFNTFIMKYGFIISFPLLAVLCILVSAKFDASVGWMNSLNIALSSRLDLGLTGIEKYGFPLFGAQLKYVSYGDIQLGLYDLSEYFFIDCSYLSIMLGYGVIMLALICIGFSAIQYRSVKSNNKYLCLALLFLAIHSMTDPQLFDIVYDPFLLMLATYVNPWSLNKCSDLIGETEQNVKMRSFRIKMKSVTKTTKQN